MSKTRWRIASKRDVLLIEIERRCAAGPECQARIGVGLTKEEARAYCGFECERCKRWTSDALTERDVPEWWQDLILCGPDLIREEHVAEKNYEPSEVAIRMSELYRQAQDE